MSTSPVGPIMPFCTEFLGRDVLGHSGEDCASSIWVFKAWVYVGYTESTKQQVFEGNGLQFSERVDSPAEGEQERERSDAW